jgi:hypothetical protein
MRTADSVTQGIVHTQHEQLLAAVACMSARCLQYTNYSNSKSSTYSARLTLSEQCRAVASYQQMQQLRRIIYFVQKEQTVGSTAELRCNSDDSSTTGTSSARYSSAFLSDHCVKLIFNEGRHVYSESMTTCVCFTVSQLLDIDVVTSAKLYHTGAFVSRLPLLYYTVVTVYSHPIHWYHR